MFETVITDVKDVIAFVFVLVISLPSYNDKDDICVFVLVISLPSYDDFPREKRTLTMIQATRIIDINETLTR